MFEHDEIFTNVRPCMGCDYGDVNTNLHVLEERYELRGPALFGERQGV